ncbi:MAG: preprotein translocase subunit SecG [Bacteroidales bacterium]|nr:preprotein translocase subunit SecG [Bacteroidales bacterium]MBQ4021276.1 preprotein translocase subunit SecG [Bacteroidales bacterium]MBR3526855.1 preprotein translocase subunit SecG [Bacteroidales bacterium]MCR5828379.1 preprotein translocase subunit SecG [Bacteroidales bacterium]
MQAAYITVSVIIMVISVLLTLVVLVQNSKGGGLAANFASGNTTFGVRQTADFLEKTTWVLAAAVMVLCIAATFLIPNRRAAKDNVREMIEQTIPAEGQPSLPANTLPLETPAE